MRAAGRTGLGPARICSAGARTGEAGPPSPQGTPSRRCFFGTRGLPGPRRPRHFNFPATSLLPATWARAPEPRVGVPPPVGRLGRREWAWRPGRWGRSPRGCDRPGAAGGSRGRRGRVPGGGRRRRPGRGSGRPAAGPKRHHGATAPAGAGIAAAAEAAEAERWLRPGSPRRPRVPIPAPRLPGARRRRPPRRTMRARGRPGG